MADRYFTPRDVNRVIPELDSIVKYMRTLEGEIQDKEWRLKQAKVEARRQGEALSDISFLKEEAEIDFLRIVARGQLERVRDLGGEVKVGYMIDFRGKIDGQDVLLCWKPGETEIRWYHGLFEGMIGRKPIPPELLDNDEAPPDLEAH